MDARVISAFTRVFDALLPAHDGSHQAASFTYSKSPGLLSMPTRGGAIQLANLPGSTTCFIKLWMKSPSCVDGSHLSCCAFQVVASTISPVCDALMSLNSPIWRWKATCGSWNVHG